MKTDDENKDLGGVCADFRNKIPLSDQWTSMAEYLRKVIDETDAYIEYEIHLRPDADGPYLIKSNEHGSVASWCVHRIKEPKGWRE